LRPHASDCKGMCAIYTPFAERLPKLPPSLHRVDRMLAHVSCLQRGEADYSFHLHLPSEAVDACESSIEKYSLRDGTTVVLNLGASRAAKRWPPERFRLLAEELIGKGFRAIVTGAASFPYDRNYDSRVAADFFGPSFADGSDCVNLVNEQNLAPDLHLQRDTHLLRYSGVPRVVVGSDTGPMQIAGSVGTDAAVRTISLFGPTNWQRYAPYDPSREYPHKPNGDHNSVITAGRPDCVPQDNREACNRYRRGCRSAECMENITVDMVMERVLAAAR
jgi:ADP-heptose:LPS heptosyltransferase